jgi:hypothetical protein
LLQIFLTIATRSLFVTPPALYFFPVNSAARDLLRVDLHKAPGQNYERKSESVWLNTNELLLGAAARASTGWLVSTSCSRSGWRPTAKLRSESPSAHAGALHPDPNNCTFVDFGWGQ